MEEERSRIIILWMITHEPCTSAGIINLDGIQMKGAFAKKKHFDSQQNLYRSSELQSIIISVQDVHHNILCVSYFYSNEASKI